MKITESFLVRLFVSPRHVLRMSHRQRGMTLIEVMVAMGVLTLTTLGILGTFIQSRRTTNFQKNEMLVDTLVQGIMEQLRNRTAVELLPNPIPAATTTIAPANCLSSMTHMIDYINGGGTRLTVGVELDTNPGNNVNQLIISPEPYLDPTNIIPGAMPVDIDGNGYGDINGDGTDDVGVNTVFLDVKGTNGLDGTVNNTSDDIRVDLMIWIRDYSQANADRTTIIPSRGILINYTWTYTDGRTTRRMIGSARAIKTPL